MLRRRINLPRAHVVWNLINLIWSDHIATASHVSISKASKQYIDHIHSIFFSQMHEVILDCLYNTCNPYAELICRVVKNRNIHKITWFKPDGFRPPDLSIYSIQFLICLQILPAGQWMPPCYRVQVQLSSAKKLGSAGFCNNLAGTLSCKRAFLVAFLRKIRIILPAKREA